MLIYNDFDFTKVINPRNNVNNLERKQSRPWPEAIYSLGWSINLLTRTALSRKVKK